MEYKYRFTLFVPCYNSSKFIHRVFDSIDNFTFRDFELIIVNDCSTDNTSQIINVYISKVDFPVKFLDREKNAGLHENIRYGLENAEGELFLLMGHDDEWLPETLEVFDETIKRYDNEKIAGIGCLCKTQFGNLVAQEYSKDVLITSCFNVYYEKNKTRKEIPYLYKTKIYKEYVKNYPPSLNLDLMIGCDYDVVFINKILRIYYINENPTRLTARTRKEVADEVYVTNLYFINKFQYQIRKRYVLRVRGFVRFVYYGCLINKPLKTMICDVSKRVNKVVVAFIYLPLWVVSKIYS